MAVIRREKLCGKPLLVKSHTYLMFDEPLALAAPLAASAMPPRNGVVSPVCCCSLPSACVIPVSRNEKCPFGK